MAWEFERLGDSFGDVLDGPLWDGEGLLFCKVLKSEILRYDGKSGQISTFRPFSLRTSGLALGPDRRLYGAQSGSRRIVWFKNDGSTAYLNAQLSGHGTTTPTTWWSTAKAASGSVIRTASCAPAARRFFRC